MRTAPADWTRSMTAPLASTAATLATATALTGVVHGTTWFMHIAVAVVIVACVGIALRATRLPVPVVSVAQLFALFMLVTALYTGGGLLGVIPTPSSMGQLGAVLSAAGQQIRIGLPPVVGTMPILCLSTLCIGVVAIIVDTIAVGLAHPAASGLVLLCVYAVPASLADAMLPWWTFVVGALAFAVLIAVDGEHKHRRWRGKRTSGSRHVVGALGPASVAAVAIVAGLLAGVTATGIGTAGSLPFGAGSQNAFDGGIGLQPFTQLRGMLNDQGNTEVFRVTGLPADQPQLLRAFTLEDYTDNSGWHRGKTMPPGQDITQKPLARSDGDKAGSRPATVEIHPTFWKAFWLPLYGKPRQISGLKPGWVYDVASGIAYTEHERTPAPYQLTTSLAQPSRRQLESIPAVTSPDVKYTELPPIDPKVRKLTDDIVQGKHTPFAKARAIWKYFTGPNSKFIYDTRTADATDPNALKDFLFKGRRGYCAQFASAMAVMLRLEKVPTRVAIGFTQGTQKGAVRSITTRDAHAWVEAYFGRDVGWVSFDPTPLNDGRGFTPQYLQSGKGAKSQNERPDHEQQQSSGHQDRSQQPRQQAPQQPQQQKPHEKTNGSSSWGPWSALLFVFVAGGLTGGSALIARRDNDARASGSGDARRLAAARRRLPVVAAAGRLVVVVVLGVLVSWWLALGVLVVAVAVGGPALVREMHRGRRLYDVSLSRPAAASSAWQELLDECADRGTPVSAADTVRQSARDLATQHHLDDDGKQRLGTLVRSLERSWYSPSSGVDEEFSSTFERFRSWLRTNAPLSWKARLLPESVLARLRGRR